MIRQSALALLALLAASSAMSSVRAQDITPPGFKLAPLKEITPATPAKALFGRKTKPAALPQQSIGFYARGCLAGASALPPDGPSWQVMRPSRNRNWGNQALIDFIERFAARVPQVSSWPGILIGDMAQPRGGPMINGHASHQVGLDADIWLAPMPRTTLSRAQRESMLSINVVAANRLDVDPARWSADDLAVIRAAAIDPVVKRIFVNPAIKKAICRQATGDRSWLTKIRPEYGHDYHFHVRIACPAGDALCKPQDPPPPGDSCGADLAQWFREGIVHPKPPKTPPTPPRPVVMADLPTQCRDVLSAPDAQ